MRWFFLIKEGGRGLGGYFLTLEDYRGETVVLFNVRRWSGVRWFF